jgi:hypothetical protein
VDTLQLHDTLVRFSVESNVMFEMPNFTRPSRRGFGVDARLVSSGMPCVDPCPIGRVRHYLWECGVMQPVGLYIAHSKRVG